MKKYINLSWCLLLVLGMASCDTDDDIRDEPRDLGGYATLTNSSISVLDTNSDLNIGLYLAPGVTAETVEIIQDGQTVGTATVSGETASFNTSILGDLEAGSSESIRIRTTYSNGNVSEDPFSVSVSHAISLGEDNPTQANMDEIDAVTLAYDVFTFSASVDNVELELKKNEAGTYADSGVVLPNEQGEGEVVLSETNYETLNLTVGDTLYYRFTVSSGSLSDTAESFVAVVPNEFESSHSATLSSDPAMNQLDLSTGDSFADGAEEGDIRFLAPSGFEVINSNMAIVEVSNGFFADADVISAREAFEAGTPVTVSPANLENGDTFVYRVTRDVENEDGEVETFTYYGVLEIGNITSVDGTVVSYEVNFAEGL